MGKSSKRKLEDTETDRNATASERVKDKNEYPRRHVELGLHFPQPKSAPPVQAAPIETLPEWLRSPIEVDANVTKKWNDLLQNETVWKNLDSSDYGVSMGIQSGVIPMLVPGPQHYNGDICIASGTGTGKTLAFMAPLISDLARGGTTKLRGLVIVPTREAVAQTLAVANLCAAKSSFKIGTGRGNRAISQERRLLLRKIAQLDPEEWEEKWGCPFNPMDVDIMEDDASDSEWVHLEGAPNFVPEYQSKVDLLICTPGRLVEHMRTSKGFTLDHVEWLVVDEVDRLLEQSFQDWTSIVMPALEHNPSGMSVRDACLAGMPWRALKRRVKKIVASATITTDMEKLSALQLCQPRLVTLSADGTERHQDKVYQVPATLREEAQPIREAADKPLVLTKLLDQILNLSAGQIRASQNDAISQTHLQGSDISMVDDETSSSGSFVSESSSSDDSDSSTEDESSDEDSSSSISSHAESVDSTSSSGSSAASDEADGSTVDMSASMHNVLVFTSKNENAMRLSRLLAILRPTWQIGTFTGSSRTSDREKVLSAFRKGHIQVLIASNLAARVLSIDRLTHVINYDMPASAETYVHRVGRTARAGKIGTATTLIAHHEARWFWKELGQSELIERQKKVVRMPPMSFNDDQRNQYQHALDQLAEETRGT